MLSAVELSLSMADQAAFEQSPGQSSIFRYSEDGSVYESVMDKGHAEEQPKGGEVLDPFIPEAHYSCYAVYRQRRRRH